MGAFDSLPTLADQGRCAKRPTVKARTSPLRYRMGARSKREHVHIAESALGKRLPNGAEVHHVDGNGQNNAHSNLVICQDHAYHYLLHVRALVVKHGGNPNTQRVCGRCRQPKDFSQFYVRRTEGHRRQSMLMSVCKACVKRGRQRSEAGTR
jgi:hypothetical protein